MPRKYTKRKTGNTTTDKALREVRRPKRKTTKKRSVPAVCTSESKQPKRVRKERINPKIKELQDQLEYAKTTNAELVEEIVKLSQINKQNAEINQQNIEQNQINKIANAELSRKGVELLSLVAMAAKELSGRYCEFNEYLKRYTATTTIQKLKEEGIDVETVQTEMDPDLRKRGQEYLEMHMN